VLQVQYIVHWREWRNHGLHVGTSYPWYDATPKDHAYLEKYGHSVPIKIGGFG
jgi:hypothetical protein